jgi:linearmycin/streptolysin S transport system permease protein
VKAVLRAIGLTMENEARLLARDPVVLLMLLLAPVVIITVAGYSLGSLYGATGRTVRVPVVNRDRGEIAAGIVDALRAEPGVAVEIAADVDEALRRLRAGGRAPLAIEVPEGTSEAALAGRDAKLVLHVDPARRLEVNALEVRIGKLCREASGRLRAAARAAAAAASLAAGALGAPAAPGGIDFAERAAIDGAPMTVNAFDQYVPGFGITFLLIGMMLGIALTLFDERDWGTLERLRAGGAPLAGVLVGKVLARFLVGVAQMAVLFAVGRLLFGISLGRSPAALVLPTVAMSFAAAALGLVVPALADAHDSVMPIGTMTSMALSAIGGCWWPLDFEPEWMRAVAAWLPTTWTMQAYNDLMIRRLPASAALWPALTTLGLGSVFLAIGILGNLRRRA